MAPKLAITIWKQYSHSDLFVAIH